MDGYCERVEPGLWAELTLYSVSLAAVRATARHETTRSS